MKIIQSKKNGGYVLLIVMVMCLVGLTFMAGSMDWADGTSKMTDRSNEYLTTCYAAEAAAASAMAKLVSDYKISGENIVLQHLDQYKISVPGSSNAYWSSYQFTDGSSSTNNTGRMTVARTGTNVSVYMKSPYAGLYAISSTYQVVANAKNTTSRWQVPAAVGSEINVGIIPIFQFAIFYDADMEIAPGPNMTVTGLVHCNHNIYVSPGATLTFQSDVSSSQNIINGMKPGNPEGANGGTTVYQGSVLTNVSALNLPVGTTNTHAILEMPPGGESATNGFGTNRLFNQADMIISITNGPGGSNNVISVTSGIAINNSNTTIPTVQWTNFLNVSNTFWNVREAAMVKAVTLDVGKLRTWSGTNTVLRSLLGNRDVSSVYIADVRTMSSTNESGIVITNGRTLPSLGLTVATPNPAYVVGDYNTSTDNVSFYPGTNETSHTYPAAILCDAINILSTAWNPNTGISNLSTRVAQPTTVNSALLTGIVATTGTASSPGNYSGGVENLPRFLEDWSGTTFTYNGSMVVLYTSANERGPWLGTGSTYNIYNPPVRNWAFDKNFMVGSRQPPLTPKVTVVAPARWAFIAPNSTNF